MNKTPSSLPPARDAFPREYLWELPVTLALVFLVVALVCFLVGSTSVASPVGLVPVGLAFLTLSILVGGHYLR